MLQVRFWIRWRRLNLLGLFPTVEKKRAQTQHTFYLPKEHRPKWNYGVWLPWSCGFTFPHFPIPFFLFSLSLLPWAVAGWKDRLFLQPSKKFSKMSECLVVSSTGQLLFLSGACTSVAWETFWPPLNQQASRAVQATSTYPAKSGSSEKIHRNQESSTQPKTFLAVLSLRFAG